MVTILTFSLISAVFHGASTASALLRPRNVLGETLQLYVWGNNIPGLRIFYADGAAVFTDDATASTLDNLVPVTFTMTEGATELGFAFTAAPNTVATVENAATKAPPFATASWFIPLDRSASHEVGFLTNESDASTREVARTDGFLIGEDYFRVIEPDSVIYSSVYCAFTTTTPGVWSLSWNETADDGIPVDLRSIPYPTGVNPPNREGRKCQTTNY